MKNRLFFGALLSVGITLNGSAQYDPPSGIPIGSTMVSVKTSNSDLIPTQVDFPFGVVNEQLVNVLTDFNITAYFQSMSYANKQSLKELYTLWCECNGGDLVDALVSLNEFDEVYVLYDSCFTGEDLYDPLNYMWDAHANDWLWFLKQINAEYAWDITLGDPNALIAIIDNGVFDFDHPDLSSEYVNLGPYDLYDLQPFFPPDSIHNHHATTVSSIASAETAESGTQPQGQLASIGFNTKMLAYTRFGDLPAKITHASTVNNAKVINCSFINNYT